MGEIGVGVKNEPREEEVPGRQRRENENGRRQNAEVVGEWKRKRWRRLQWRYEDLLGFRPSVSETQSSMT